MILWPGGAIMDAAMAESSGRFSLCLDEMFSQFIPVIVECLEATRVQLLDVYQ